MPNTPLLLSPMNTELSEILRHASRYQGGSNEIELERLYRLNAMTLKEFADSIKSEYQADDPVVQNDVFDDVFVGGTPQFADLDFYLRRRWVESLTGEFISFEIKVGYPGPASNRNLRPSPAEVYRDQEKAKEWSEHLSRLGLSPERTYRKVRSEFESLKTYGGYKVTLEVDEFVVPTGGESVNGPLAGRCFVSFSVEVPAEQRGEAERALDLAIQAMPVGVSLEPVAGNYEDVFYGRLLLP